MGIFGYGSGYGLGFVERNALSLNSAERTKGVAFGATLYCHYSGVSLFEGAEQLRLGIDFKILRLSLKWAEKC